MTWRHSFSPDDNPKTWGIGLRKTNGGLECMCKTPEPDWANPRLLAASIYYGVGNIKVSDHFSNLLSVTDTFLLELIWWLTHFHCRFEIWNILLVMISQNDINSRDVSNVKFRITVNKECKRATKIASRITRNPSNSSVIVIFIKLR